MSKRQLAIVGAFDRFNYGDLLFPIIIERALESLNGDIYTYKHYALTKSDLSRFGARKTEPLHRLRASLGPNDIVMFGGGEILGSRWGNMLLHSSNKVTGLTIRAIRKLFGIKFAEYVARTITQNNDAAFRFPWVLQPKDFDNSPAVVYNAVGGFSRLKVLTQPERTYIYERLKKATYISVREKNLHQLLVNEASIPNVALSPDSAILMSEFFSRSELEQRASTHTQSILDRHTKGYVCLQISELHARGEIDTIADQLETLFHKSGLGAVLLPIGRAPGHEDQVALKEIAARTKTPVNMPEDDIGIYDIMFLIASSACFVGTSLHGVVTALSYAVSHVGLTRKVAKLSDFLESWDISEQRECAPSSSLAGAVDAALHVPQNKRDSKRDELIRSSWRDFEAISQHIAKNSFKLRRQLYSKDPSA